MTNGYALSAEAKRASNRKKEAIMVAAGKAEAIKARKRTEAEVRQETYDNLSAREKVAKLDARLGKGKGAEKERLRILASWNKPGGETDGTQEIPLRDIHLLF